MILQSPGDVAFNIINFPVYWYGIVLAFAVLSGVLCAEYISAKYLPEKFFIETSPLIIILGIIGARLYYCIVNFNYYINNPLEIIDIRQGGMSVHGMIIAGIAAYYFICKKYKTDFFRVLDISSCGVSLAQAIGRWGNFFNSEAFGYPTNSDWGLFIPVSDRPLPYLNHELFHPAFLYESVLDLFIFFLLLKILKKSEKPGYTFFGYLILYGTVRIFVENIRIDSVLNISGMPVAIWVSLFCVIAGCIGVFLKKLF